MFQIHRALVGAALGWRSGSQGAIGAIADRLLGPRGCLFTFHRGAAGKDWARLPNRDFYLNLDFLDELLGYLKATDWDVVTIGEAAERTRGDTPFRKFVNFSIDDCYRDTYEAVVPLFRRHGVPITIYVTTGIPDGSLPLADAGLEDALMRDRVFLADGPKTLTNDTERRALYRRLSGEWDGPPKAEHYAAFCAANGIDAERMHWKHAISWDMLDRLSRDPLVEIGAHTITHARISALSSEAAMTELHGSRKRLEAKLNRPVKHFAFPYGRSGDCGPRDFAIGMESGYQTVATTRKGLMWSNTPLDRLPRVTLNGNQQSLSMADAHLAGISAFAAEVLGRV